MKKALVLAGVLCLLASVGRAALLECWITVDNPNPNQGQTFNVSIWLQVVPDPALTAQLGHVEDVSQSGIECAGVSVYQQNPYGNYSALPASSSGPEAFHVLCVFNTSSVCGFDQVWPARLQDNLPAGYCENWPTFDAVDAAGLTSGNDLTVAVAGPVLLCTESWTCLYRKQAQLHVTMPYIPYYGPNNLPGLTKGQLVPAAGYWDYNDQTGSGSYWTNYTNYSIGILDNGVFTPGEDLILNAPEPTSLALLALGAVGLVRKRKPR
jgi:hypothetical protein